MQPGGTEFASLPFILIPLLFSSLSQSRRTEMVPEAHQVGAFLILFKAPLEGGGWGGGGIWGVLRQPRPQGAFPVFKVGLEISLPTSKARKKCLKTRLVLGLIFAGYVLLASQSPQPIIVYSVANYRPILVTLGQISNFRDPNSVTFYFYELTHFLD